MALCGKAVIFPDEQVSQEMQEPSTLGLRPDWGTQKGLKEGLRSTLEDSASQ
jgi:hypothetical protein